MNRIYAILVCHMLYATSTSWADTIQYRGTITTLCDDEYPIHDLCIGNKQKCMLVYKAPANIDTIIPTLSYNPKDHASHIKLSDVKEIAIVYPYTTWVYKDKKKDKYLLIKIRWNDSAKEHSTYLIEPKRRLSCQIIKEKSTTYRKIPFSGIKKISISGSTQN